MTLTEINLAHPALHRPGTTLPDAVTVLAKSQPGELQRRAWDSYIVGRSPSSPYTSGPSPSRQRKRLQKCLYNTSMIGNVRCPHATHDGPSPCAPRLARPTATLSPPPPHPRDPLRRGAWALGGAAHSQRMPARGSCQVGGGGYRCTSLIRNSASLGPYSRNMPRALW